MDGDRRRDFQSEALNEEEETCDKAPIHSLPTELLVLIFSFISVDDLSMNVSKVCLRWRDAMHFKTLWHSKELIYQNAREDSFIFVLRVAPSLRKLTITPLFCEDPGAIISAIRKGPKDIKEIHYNLSLFPYDTGARILGHFKDYVCELHLVGDAKKQSCLYRNLGAVLGQMSQLRSLKLSGYFDTRWDKNVLEQGCMELHHLDVSQIQDESDSYLPFLDSVKSNLKTLSLPQVKSNVRDPAVIALCSELKEITLCLDDLRFISGLHSLEALHIKWSDKVPQGKMNKFIRECSVFGNLKELTLHYIPGPIASAIAKQCHKLEILNMHGIISCTNIIKTVFSVSKLCVVDRLSLRMRHVQKLPKYLPNLKYLDLRGCFVNRGIPPKILLQLKSQLPGLQVVSDEFVSYTKHGNKGYSMKCTDSSTDCSSDEA